MDTLGIDITLVTLVTLGMLGSLGSLGTLGKIWTMVSSIPRLPSSCLLIRTILSLVFRSSLKKSGRLQGRREKVNGTKDAFLVQLALLIYIILDID